MTREQIRKEIIECYGVPLCLKMACTEMDAERKCTQQC